MAISVCSGSGRADRVRSCRQAMYWIHAACDTDAAPDVRVDRDSKVNDRGEVANAGRCEGERRTGATAR